MLFNSIQFNSIQFNSIPKIISLIVLLFILLFSISCKSKQNPEEHSRAELVGTWNNPDGNGKGLFNFNIDSGGNLNFNCDLITYSGWHYNYAGKLADTFDYPYTIELTFTVSSHSSITSCIKQDSTDSSWLNARLKELNPQLNTAKFTFTDASTCIASVNMIRHGSGRVHWASTVFGDNDTSGNYLVGKSFKKQ